LFKARYQKTTSDGVTTFLVEGSAVFSNLVPFKKIFNTFENGQTIKFDLSKTILIDHSFLVFIHHFQKRYNEYGGHFEIYGIEKHKPLSDHPLATRKLIKEKKRRKKARKH
jgi:MFS superfamily sulfate permease-like transporter